MHTLTVVPSTKRFNTCLKEVRSSSKAAPSSFSFPNTWEGIMCEYSDFSKTSSGDWVKFVQKKTFNASPWHCRTWLGWLRRTGGWNSFPRRLSRTVPLIFTQMITFTNLAHSSETDLVEVFCLVCCYDVVSSYLAAAISISADDNHNPRKRYPHAWGGLFCIPPLPCLTPKLCTFC